MAKPKPIKLLDDLRHLLRPLSAEERAGLAASIAREGLREPLSVWDRGSEYVLLDGYNRHEICRELGIQIDRRRHIKVIPGINSLEDAERWMVNNQMARRNLTPNERAYLIGVTYNKGKRQGARTDLSGEETMDAAASLGREFHVSDRAIRAMGQFAEAVDLLEETIGAKARILYQVIPLSREEVVFIADQQDEEHRELFSRALADRQDLEKVMKARAASKRSRLRAPRMRRPAPSAAEYYDIAELVRIIGEHWPIGRINDLPDADSRQANIYDQHLNAAIASLQALRRNYDGFDEAAPAEQ